MARMYNRLLMISIALAFFQLISQKKDSQSESSSSSTRGSWQQYRDAHPIDALMSSAKEQMSSLLSRRTHTLQSTIQAYRSRRQQEPPPGFDNWYKLAQASNAIIVEQMWDTIYEDLQIYAAAFTTIESQGRHKLRHLAEKVATSRDCPEVKEFRISSTSESGALRGTVSSNCEDDNHPCLEVQAMISQVSHLVPDMKIAVNIHASPRVVVPYERIPTGESSTGIPPREMQEQSHDSEHGLFNVPTDWASIWLNACPPSSSVGHLRSLRPPRTVTENSKAPSIPSTGSESHSYVSDVSAWRDVCRQPWLLDMHGVFIRPNAMQIAQQLVPVFASARVQGAEAAIIFPDTIYWAQDPSYYHMSNDTDTGRYDSHRSWLQKSPKAYWRGSNTGGGHGATNWWRFHRHRFVAATNASYLMDVRRGRYEDRVNVSFPITDRIISLAENHTDVGFSSIICRDDKYRTANQGCSYLDANFHPLPHVPLRDVLSDYRFLLDVDGNSYSGRFRALLLSESVVFKATIFREWHDARLVPWLHFVPVSNHFGQDLWDALEYFLEHEQQGEKLARAARDWARQVLRPVDMEIYLLRLLLEWARMIQP